MFVSYRREDSQSATLLLVALLRENGFGGRGDIFLDMDHIPPGKGLPGRHRRDMQECDLVIVVIGRSWLDLKDSEDRRPLDDLSDTHRLEVVALSAPIPE